MSRLPTHRSISKSAQALFRVKGRRPHGGTSSLFTTLGAGGVCGVVGVTVFAFAAEAEVRREANEMRSEAVAAIEYEQAPLSLGENRSVAGDLILTEDMVRQGEEHLAAVDAAQEELSDNDNVPLEATPFEESGNPTANPEEAPEEAGDTESVEVNDTPSEDINLEDVVDAAGPAEITPVYDNLDLGAPLALLTIPKLDLEYPVVFGDGKQQLKVGVGQVPGTPSIGTYGNAVLAGHRTSNGAPFYDLDLLAVGDQFTLAGVFGILTYEVNRTEIVTPDNVASILTSDWTRSSVTLFSCTPRGSTSHRLLVHADLVGDPINLIT